LFVLGWFTDVLDNKRHILIDYGGVECNHVFVGVFTVSNAMVVHQGILRVELVFKGVLVVWLRSGRGGITEHLSVEYLFLLPPELGDMAVEVEQRVLHNLGLPPVLVVVFLEGVKKLSDDTGGQCWGVGGKVLLSD
jgi:hypothetical protein